MAWRTCVSREWRVPGLGESWESPLLTREEAGLGARGADAGPLERRGLKTGGVWPGLCTRRLAQQEHGEGALLGNLSER